MLLENNVLGFFRQFKGDFYQVWIEKFHNGKGTYVRLTKCVRGVIKAVVVPQGSNNIGWALLKENLEVILTGKTTSNRGNPSVDFERSVSWGNGRVFGKTYKEAVGKVIWSDRKGSDIKSRENVAESQVTDEESRIPWSRVVVCERQAVHQSWNEIAKALSGWLEKEVGISHYMNNRAFFVCDNLEEAQWCAKVGKISMDGAPDLLLFSWKQSLENNMRKVVSYGGWIAISGLPLHWWSQKFFRRIGEACGGLIDVDLRTSNFEYLIDAKLRVKSNDVGLLPGDLRIEEDGEVHLVQIRPLTPAIRSHPKSKPSLVDRRIGMMVDSGLSLSSGRRSLELQLSHQGTRRDYFPGGDKVGEARGSSLGGMGDQVAASMGMGEDAEADKEKGREAGINEMGGNLQTGIDDNADLLVRDHQEGGVRVALHERQIEEGGPRREWNEVGFPVGPKLLTGLCGPGGPEGRALNGDYSRDVLLDGSNNIGPMRDMAEGEGLLGSKLVVGLSGDWDAKLGTIKSNGLNETGSMPERPDPISKGDSAFFSKFGGSSARGRHRKRDDSQLRFEPVESGEFSKAGSFNERGDDGDSFCPDSVDFENEELAVSESTESIDVSSEDERERLDVIEKEPGLLVGLFSEQATPLCDPSKEEIGDPIGFSIQMAKPMIEPKLKFCRRQSDRRNNDKTGETKARTLTSKMNLAVVPLKRNLIQRNGGMKLDCHAIGGRDKVRSGRGDPNVD